MSTTSYALLGLLAFDVAEGENEAEATGLTGYEIKQRADRTLRFYWVSPAMSQVYSEMDRLVRLELVDPSDEKAGKRKTRRFSITASGLTSLQTWLSESDTDFPTLKHPVALKLLMGGLLGPEQLQTMLEKYREDLALRQADLTEVRAQLGDDETLRYPALVAEWGLDYYDAEVEITNKLIKKLNRL